MNITILKTIFEIAIWLIPFALGVGIFVRGKESYGDSYDHSSARGLGVSFKKYMLLFRIFGLILILAAGGIFYYLYIRVPENKNAEINEFWEKIEKNKTGITNF